MVAVQIESKGKFAKKENGGLTGRLILRAKGRYSEISNFTQKVVEPRTEMEKEGGRPLLRDDELSFREIHLANR